MFVSKYFNKYHFVKKKKIVEIPLWVGSEEHKSLHVSKVGFICSSPKFVRLDNFLRRDSNHVHKFCFHLLMAYFPWRTIALVSKNTKLTIHFDIHMNCTWRIPDTRCKLKPVTYKVEYCSNVYFGCQEYWFMSYFLDTHVRKDLRSSPTSHPHPLWTSVWWQTSLLEESRNTPRKRYRELRNTPGRDLGIFASCLLGTVGYHWGCLVLQVKKYF